MTDLHTHILPGMDDGAQTVQMSLALLRMQRAQGVDTVALTPHFYRTRENPKMFLTRREAAVRQLEASIAALPEDARARLPRLCIGAEVAWAPNLADWDELPQLCFAGTKNLLLELPVTPWNDAMIHGLYDLMGRTGITPVIAHLERYLKRQSAEHILAVQELGVPVQISARMVLHPLSRAAALRMIRYGEAHLLASDCHDPSRRGPILAEAMQVVRRKLGEDFALQLDAQAQELLEP